MRYIGGEFIEEDTDRYLLKDAVVERKQIPDNALMLQSGSDGIAAIINQNSRAPKITLYHPVNFCNATLKVIRAKVKNELNLISYQSAQELNVPAANEAAFLLVVHFNAVYNDMLKINPQVLKKFIVIEDFVQYPFHIHKRKAKYAVNSLRKIASIELSLVYGINESEQFSIGKSRYFLLKKKAVEMKQRYLRGEQDILESHYLNLFRQAEEELNTDQIFIAQESEKKKLAKLDIKTLIRKRRRNFKALSNLLKDCKQITILPGSYMYFMILTDQQTVLKKHLAKNGIFTTIHWADSADLEFNTHSLSIPIDQRYNLRDLHRIAKAIIDFFE